jgi:hypothetical protein
LDVERDTLHVGLVGDVARVDLQGHRVAELVGDQDRLIGAAGQDGLGDRDVEGGQQRLRFHFRQPGAAFRQHAFDQHARPFQVRLGEVGQRRRGLLQQLLVLVKRGDVAERVHCRFRRAKTRNAGAGDDLARSGNNMS